MDFSPAGIPGSFVIDIRPIKDERGFFARTWCADELRAQGLVGEIAQINTALSHAKGTLRGMHLQAPPHGEAKIVSCQAGRVFDVVVDLRPDSPSYCQWRGFELSAENFRMLYIPEGCAHGYQTLEDNCVLSYTTSERYAPDSATGVRFDDPAFAVDWPLPPSVVSKADSSWPEFKVAS